MMRDLLYLSENKMRALIPQLPGQIRRRLGFEAGLNVGVASARASLPGEPQPSSIALLDAVVEMIEQEKGSRWRTDPDLRTGDWIQFEEEFLYGDAATAGRALSGLVYFAARSREAPFVLCGSSVHVLDRWQSGKDPGERVGYFYMDAILDYAEELARLPDEAAITEIIPPDTSRNLWYAISVLCSGNRRMTGDWAVSSPVRLSGHARVLAAGSNGADGPLHVLATPLYVQYARHRQGV